MYKAYRFLGFSGLEAIGFSSIELKSYNVLWDVVRKL